jgi:hypothetical protein
MQHRVAWPRVRTGLSMHRASRDMHVQCAASAPLLSLSHPARAPGSACVLVEGKPAACQCKGAFQGPACTTEGLLPATLLISPVVEATRNSSAVCLGGSAPCHRNTLTSHRLGK